MSGLIAQFIGWECMKVWLMTRNLWILGVVFIILWLLCVFLNRL